MNKQSWKLFPLDWLLLSTVIYAAMRCLQTSFDMTVNNLLLYLWVVLLTGLFCALFRLQFAWAAALCGLLALLLGYLWFRNTLNDNLKELARAVFYTLTRAYAWVDGLITLKAPEAGVDLTAAFLLVSALLTLLVCATVVWLRTALPATLFCVAAIMPCFFLLDTPPQAIWLVLLTLGLLVLAFSQGVRSRAPDEAAQATVFALVPAVLIVGLTLLLFPEQNYKPPVQLDEVTQKIAEIGERIGSKAQTGGASVEQVNLRTLGAKQQSAREALRVNADKQPAGMLYLRGMAYESFDGDRWQLGELPSGVGAVLGSGTQAGGLGDTATVRIHTDTPRKICFTPNNLVPITLETAYDQYVPNSGKQRDYSYRIYVPGGSGADASSEPAIYLPQKEREACLYLPEQTRASLYQIASANGIATASDLSALVAGIVNFVKNSAEYDLAPERVPDGEDFCTWFLTEAESGYCVHFASSATALLRAVGVPARYVEGYVTTVQAGEDTIVEERQAHAWVEAFVDGVGWVLYDPTPASGVEDSATPRASGQEEETETATEDGEGGEVTEPAEPSAPTESSAGIPNEPTLPTESQQQGEGLTPQTPKKPLPVGILVVVGLILAVVGLYVLRRVRRRDAFARAKGKRLAMLYWKRHKQFCKALRTEPDKDCEALAKKAHFSQHPVQPEEIRLLADTVRKQERALATLPDLKRYWYSYWLL